MEPMSGYHIREVIIDTLGHFWHESFGQIYPTLSKAEAAGHVRRLAHGKTSGSVFELTDAGAQRLRELLLEPDEPARPRNGVLLRLFFGTSLGPAACIELLRDAERRATFALERLEAIRSEVAHEVDAGARYRMLTVTYGITVSRAQRDWARESIAVLKMSSDQRS